MAIGLDSRCKRSRARAQNYLLLLLLLNILFVF